MARTAPSWLRRARVRAGAPWREPSTRQALVALLLNSSTSLVAGAMLGSIQGTLAEFPGLLVLVPAAIGLRGNVFGAVGNRLSTAIHSGTFGTSLRPSTVLGQNLIAAAYLTVIMSVVLAVCAKALALALGVGGSPSFTDLAVISVAGGALGSLVVMASTVWLAMGAVRFGWDLDNVTAPLVSTLGDVLTLPALFAATYLAGRGYVSPLLGWAAVAVAVAAVIMTWRSRLGEMRRIVRESLPVLAVAGLLSALAGTVLEQRIDLLDVLPALLVLVPAHLSSSGALGGILAGRLATKVHLGLVEPRATPPRAARPDLRFVALLSIPVFVFNGAGAHVVGRMLGKSSPGLLSMIEASVLGGAISMMFVLAIAYYATLASARLGVDPDTYGIPVVSSSIDFIGALTLVLAVVALGIA